MADLRYADLRDADLRNADLRGADLRGANLDYSVFPLWCGSVGMMADERLVSQLVAHLCRLEVEDEYSKEIQQVLDRFRNDFC